MVVDVKKLIETNYIYFKRENFINNHLSASVNYFTAKFDKQRRLLFTGSSFKYLRKQFTAEDTKNYEALKALSLQGINFTEFYSEFAKALTTQLENLVKENPLILQLNVSKFKGVLTAGKKKDAILLEAFVKDLTALENLIGGDSKKFAANLRTILNQRNRKKATFIDEKDLRKISDVLVYMLRAVLRLNSGTYSKKDLLSSFTKTLVNIFSTHYGEIIFLQNILKTLEEFITSLQKIKGVEIIGFEKDILRTNMLSSSEAKTDFGGKVKVLINGKEFVLELNFSNKLYDSLTEGKDTNIHVISSSPLGTYLNRIDTPGPFYGYNIVKHNLGKGKGMDDAFYSFRNYLSLSFIDEAIMGRGNQLKIGNINTNLFLIVNGKVYSIFDILNNIVSKTANVEAISDSKALGVKINFEKFSPVIIKGLPNYLLGKTRSKLERKAIDKLKIGMEFNSRFLI